MNRKAVIWVKWIGKALSIISIWFIVKTLMEMDLSWIKQYHFFQLYGGLFFLSLFLVFNNSINAYAWKLYLDFFSKKKNNTSMAMGVYLKSNIAKYLPGNVVHFADRNILGNRLGIRHKIIVWASIMELLTLSASAAFCSLAFSFHSVVETVNYLFSNFLDKRVYICLFIILVIFFVVLCYICYKCHFLTKLKCYINLSFIGLLVKTFSFYICNHIISGMVLSLIFTSYLNKDFNYFMITSANIVSWFAGYVVIGSPGGIGIREAVLVFLLRNVYSSEEVLMAGVILRLCNILADFIAFISVPAFKLLKEKILKAQVREKV